MNIKSLRAKNFRNYSSVETNFSAHLNIFFGGNGQGKTNLLEAIALLSTGRSFRTQCAADFLQQGHESAALTGSLAKRQLEYQVHLELEAKSKTVQVNSKPTTASKLLQNFSCVVFCPESLMVIKEGPQIRRDLIDDFLPSFAKTGSATLAQFKKSLRLRNRLLRDLKRSLIAPLDFYDSMDSLDPIFFRVSSEVVWLRLQGLKALRPDFAATLRYISNDSATDLDLDYWLSEASCWDFSQSDIHDALRKRAFELTTAERKLGSSLVGPHKHDISFKLNGLDARHCASQGQQRAIILAFKLAQMVYHFRAYGFYPILLLDDVMSELDFHKRAKLTEFLKQTPAQIFMTTTELELLPAPLSESTACFSLNRGVLVPAERGSHV